MTGRKSATASFLPIALLIGGCQPAATTTPPAATLSASTSSQPLSDQIFVTLGPSPVGNLACDSETVAWSSSSNTDPKRIFLDTIVASSTVMPAAHVIARASHGGKLGADVKISGNWVVFQEYQQAGISANTDFWFIHAVDLTTKRSLEIAGSRQAPATLELPSVSVSGNYVVWDQLVGTSQKVLKRYDLTTESEQTLSIPTDMFPVNAEIEGSKITFLDNSTDPNRKQEAFVARGGQLMLYDLSTQKLVKLDSTVDARQSRLSGSWVAWHGTVPDPDHPNTPATVFDVRLSPIEGGKSVRLAQLGYRVDISNADVVWYDDRLPGVFMYSLKSKRTRNLGIRSLEETAPTYALCGDILYFAPLQSTTDHSIRFVKLTGA